MTSHQVDLVSRSALVVLALGLMLPLAAHAQNPQPQSVPALIAEAELVKETDPARAFELSSRAVSALAGSRDVASQLHAEWLRCWTALTASPDSMVSFAQSAVDHAQKLRQPVWLAKMIICRGEALDQAGRSADAVRDFEYGLSEGKRLRNDSIYADALLFRGEFRYYRGETNTAVVDLNTAYGIYVKQGNGARQRYTLNAIANLFADPQVGQYEKALEYYRQLLEFHEKYGPESEVAVDYFNLGSTYERQGKLAAALAEYQRGMALDQKHNAAEEVATDRRAIGVVLYKLNRPAEALTVLNRALAQFTKSANQDGIAAARLSRGIALRMLGRHTDAVNDLNAARSYYVGTDNKRFLEKVEDERSRAFAGLGQWQLAYEARQSQLELLRTLVERSRDEQTSRLRVEFEAEKKEQENRALVRENVSMQRIRQLQFAVLLLGAIIIIALIAFALRQIKNARRLRVTALTDELTGVPNRRHLLLVADEKFAQARAAGGNFAVLAVDVDNFKEINDTYGHAAGDGALSRVAATLQASLRGADVVGRTGGDEFVCILPGATETIAEDVVSRIHQAMAAGNGDHDLTVTVSVGIATLHAADATVAKLIERADEALYEVKRNRVVN